MKAFIIVVVALVMIASGFWAYVWTGSYNISAATPHWSITLKIL